MDEEGKAYDSIDLQLILDFLADFHDDIQANMEMLEDLMEKTPEIDLPFLKIVHGYMQGAKAGIDHAHLDLTDCNFRMFGNKDFKWEVK